MDRGSKEIHVLLVEDSSWTTQSIAEIVKNVVGLSTQLKVVDSEADAVATVAENRPDMIILDLMLRRGNGFGVLRKLSRSEDKPTIVVLTNYALPKYREMALLMGADYFLDKAVSMDRLPRIMEAVMEKFASAINRSATDFDSSN